MKLAVISDIHANCVALDAVLADLTQDKPDQIVCLGDAIQGGAQPAETVARLREVGCPVVMGNADAFLLSESLGTEAVSSERELKLRAVREWTLSQLSSEDREFIAAFQPTITIPLGTDRSLLCFHGSPRSFDDLIFPHTPEADIQPLLYPHLPHLMTGGHTHMQQIRRLGASDSFFFNPGSVGFSYSHEQPEDDFRCDPWAEYALLHYGPGRPHLEFRRVPIDVSAVIEAYQRSGRPYSDEAIAQYRPR